jgi:hypothetical protein
MLESEKYKNLKIVSVSQKKPSEELKGDPL